MGGKRSAVGEGKVGGLIGYWGERSAAGEGKGDLQLGGGGGGRRNGDDDGGRRLLDGSEEVT